MSVSSVIIISILVTVLTLFFKAVFEMFYERLFGYEGTDRDTLTRYNKSVLNVMSYLIDEYETAKGETKEVLNGCIKYFADEFGVTYKRLGNENEDL